MGKVLSDEDIKLNVIVNSNEAQKRLFDLEKDTRKLTEANKQLNLQKKLLESQGQKESDAYKLLTKTIKENSIAIAQNKAKMSELQKEIGITGLTMKQLTDRAYILKMSLRNAIPGTEAYAKYKAELDQINNRLSELNGKAKKAGFSISSLADNFNKYQTLAVSIIAVMTGVVLSVQKVIDINGKLADAQSNVRKTTGMTIKEVDELTKSFGLFHSRTSRINLLAIAEQGGRIGILKDDIFDFVNVMNKAAVSLGDSFTGGVEEVANKLGKLKFLFEETKNLSVDKAYNSIGSAINDLGANGVASEANIADFATRIGSLPDVLKPSIKEALALGAAFEESGIESEVSARAYNIFMKQASTESGKFAKVMKLTKQQVEDMINTNPLNFMMKFAEGMRGMDATDTAKTLEYLGVNADGANKVIGAMGNNLGRFKELIDLSNQSFSAGTSLINEYEIKNNNLAATIEKITKRITGFFSSESFTKWLADAALWIAKFIGATEDADGSVAKWRTTIATTAKILAVLIASLLGYSAGARVATLISNGLLSSTTLFNIALRLQTFWLSLQKVALIAQVFVMNMFGLSTDRASASLARLNLVTKLNPFGALLGVLTAIVVAYVAFSDSTKKAATAQETFAKQQKELASSVASATRDTKANISSLISLITDESISMGTRKKAYEELIKLSPAFNGFLKDEKFNIEGLLVVYAQYLKSLDQVTYARQFSKLNDANIKKRIDAEQQLFNAEKRLQNLKKIYKNDTSLDANSALGDAQNKINEAKENLKNALQIESQTNSFRQNKINLLEAAIKKDEKDLTKIANKTSEKYKALILKLEGDKRALESIIGKQDNPDGKSNFTVIEKEDKAKGSKKDSFKTQAEIDREKLDNEKKFQEELLKLKRQAQDDALAAMKDGYEKELLIENQRYQREIDDLESQKIRKDELAKIDENISKAKKDGDTRYYNFLIEQKKVWKEKNIQLDNQINNIIQGKLALHHLKLGVIEDNAARKKLDKTKEDYERSKVLRETKFLDELNSITTLEQAKNILKETLSGPQLSQIKKLSQAKEILQKQFNDKELTNQKIYLESLVNQLNQILTSKQFKGIDLKLLTPEMKEEFQKKIEDLKKQIAELNKLIDGVSTGDSEAKKEATNAKIAKVVSDAQLLTSSLMNTWGAYYDYMAAKENALLKQITITADRKKAALKNQLDSGLISQTLYNKKVEILDKEVEEKKFQIELKQAKRKKAMDMVSTIINTAVAIMQAYAQLGPVGGTVAAVLIGAMGALQLATISKTPLPVKGYEDGLYPEEVTRQQDGKKFKVSQRLPLKSGVYTKPTILVGENNRAEMVIDNKAFSNLSPEVHDALIRELGGVKGFENGYYNKTSQQFEVPATSTPTVLQNNDQALALFTQALNRNSAILEIIEREGIQAIVDDKDYKSMNKLDKAIKKVKDIKSQNTY